MSAERGRVLAGERVYDGRLLKVDRERVELPGGALTELETIRHPGAAAVLPFQRDGTVLLVRQYRHAAGGYLVEVPAGTLDPGERPADCAVRETEEEVGHRPGRVEPLGRILTTPGFTDEVIWLFEAFELEPARTRHDHDEVIEVVRTSLGTALEMVERGEIVDAKSVVTILRAARRRR